MLASLLLLLALAVPALAKTPEEVVKELYATHLKVKNMRKTVALVPHVFTPGFLGIIERALAKDVRRDGVFVDADFISNSQIDMKDFEVGTAEVREKDATVPLIVWIGRGNAKANWTKRQARVHLTDVGDGEGFQIRDLEFFGRPGEKTIMARAWLEKVANGR